MTINALTTMHERVKYKLSRCFVPSCKNKPSAAETSKLFFPVPRGDERNEWIRICGRKSTSLVSNLIICEDHFTLEDDVTGYNSFITAVRLGCPPPCKLKLKKGILPTKFGQDEANLSSSTISLTASSSKTATSPSNFQDPSPYNDAFPSPLANALDHRLSPEIESPSSPMNISPIQPTSSNNVMSGLSFESCNEIYPVNEATPSSHTSTETHYCTPSSTTVEMKKKLILQCISYQAELKMNAINPEKLDLFNDEIVRAILNFKVPEVNIMTEEINPEIKEELQDDDDDFIHVANNSVFLPENTLKVEIKEEPEDIYDD